MRNAGKEKADERRSRDERWRMECEMTAPVFYDQTSDSRWTDLASSIHHSSSDYQDHLGGALDHREQIPESISIGDCVSCYDDGLISRNAVDRLSIRDGICYQSPYPISRYPTPSTHTNIGSQHIIQRLAELAASFFSHPTPAVNTSHANRWYIDGNWRKSSISSASNRTFIADEESMSLEFRPRIDLAFSSSDEWIFQVAWKPSAIRRDRIETVELDSAGIDSIAAKPAQSMSCIDESRSSGHDRWLPLRRRRPFSRCE